MKNFYESLGQDDDQELNFVVLVKPANVPVTDFHLIYLRRFLHYSDCNYFVSGNWAICEKNGNDYHIVMVDAGDSYVPLLGHSRRTLNAVLEKGGLIFKGYLLSKKITTSFEGSFPNASTN